MNQLDDTSLMPFGKYRGQPMQDVPAEYFHWLFIEEGLQHNKQSDVADYIRRNLDALKLEDKDLIWT